MWNTSRVNRFTRCQVNCIVFENTSDVLQTQAMFFEPPRHKQHLISEWQQSIAGLSLILFSILTDWVDWIDWVAWTGWIAWADSTGWIDGTD